MFFRVGKRYVIGCEFQRICPIGKQISAAPRECFVIFDNRVLEGNELGTRIIFEAILRKDFVQLAVDLYETKQVQITLFSSPESVTHTAIQRE